MTVARLNEHFYHGGCFSEDVRQLVPGARLGGGKP